MDKLQRWVIGLALLPFSILLVSCGSTSTPTPSNPTLPISFTQTPTSTETPKNWQAPYHWWEKQQVQAFGSMLLYALDSDHKSIKYYQDVYDRTGVTMNNWGDVRWSEGWRERYPSIVKQLHDRDLIVIGTISLAYAITETSFFDLLRPAALRDPYGNILYEWQAEDVYALSIPHPLYQEYMQSLVRFYIDAGVDGIMIDELAYGSVHYPDFNENTMIEFRQYLQQIYTPEELSNLGKQFGVTDFSTLDYASLVRASLPPDKMSINRSEWQWDLYSKLPFFIDYQRFVRIKNLDFANTLISEGKAYAMQTYGKDIPFSANLNGLVSPEALELVGSLDYVDLEYFYQSQGYFPKGRALTSVRIAQSFGKHSYLVTSYGDTDPDIAVRGIEKSTNLFRTMIAEAYATGSALTVEEGLHNIKQDISTLAPYYRFPRLNPILFDNMSPVQGQVGLLYLWENRDVYNNTDMRGLGQMLADCGYTFNIVFGSEEFTFWGTPNIYPAPDYPLNLEALSPYPLVIVPELSDITPNHADVLLQYVNQGGKLIVYSNAVFIENIAAQRSQTDKTIKELLSYLDSGERTIGQGKIVYIDELWGRQYTTSPQPSMIQPLKEILADQGIVPEIQMSQADFVSAFMNQNDDLLTVHFVNYNYNPDTDFTTPSGPITVEIKLPLTFTTNQPSVYLYSPEQDIKELNGVISDNKLILTIPEINIWSVLLIGDPTTLQTTIASYPTITPMPANTPTPSLKTGTVIYDDKLQNPWQKVIDKAEVDLASTKTVGKGLNSIEIDAQGWGSLILTTTTPIKFSGDQYLVLLINSADRQNLELSFTLFSENQSINYVFLSGYLGSKPLKANEWREIMIPMSELNPEGKSFNTIFIQNESDNPALYFLDEIHFAAP
jgi:hypothetical protein